MDTESTNDAAKTDGESAYSQVVSGTTIIFIGKVLGLTLGFFARSVPARLLGPDKYGSLTLGWTVVSVVTFISALGLKDGITRYIPRCDTNEDRKSILLTAVSSALPWSILLTMTVVFFSEYISITIFSGSVSPGLISLFALLIPVVTINNLIVSYFRGLKNARLNVFVTNVFNPGFRVILVTGSILAGYSVFGAAVGWVVASVLTLLSAIYFLCKRTPILHVDSNGTRFAELLKFSMPLMLASSMGIVLGFGDNLLIGFYLDSAAIGRYDPAFLLSSMVTTGLTVFSYMFLPTFSELHGKGEYEEMDNLYGVVTKWIVSLTLPVYLVFAAFPASVLEIFFGDAYTSAAPVLVILATGSLINAAVGLCVQGLVATGSTRFIMYTNSFAAISNVVLNILLIPQFGIIGAALASATTTAGYNLLYAYRVYQEMNIAPVPRAVFLPSLIPVGGAILLRRVPPHNRQTLIFLILAAVLFIVLYLSGYLLFGAAEKEDIGLVETLENQIGVDLSLIKQVLKYRIG
ncbi:polysaccharide biosynthesis protein [Haloferax mucosum ATCC BAA-1512]|uniref:Polysaccharide biosynthesis protein n=1 Tax=Haloferax mucosum ATCC BAA-1512 TaxID=662479 RepID=M0IJS0_9EURY|nr:oligosaccharide flippase family protein [Haloferax mucosum]ELZ97026.1 polysaccharide biosynthesis protein [Haloferax mucosum ATCC BAA-1512]